MEELTENQKIQIIQASRKLMKKWKALKSQEGKLAVLRGMEIATDSEWLATIFEEAKEGEDLEVDLTQA